MPTNRTENVRARSQFRRDPSQEARFTSKLAANARREPIQDSVSEWHEACVEEHNYRAERVSSNN